MFHCQIGVSNEDGGVDDECVDIEMMMHVFDTCGHVERGGVMMGHVAMMIASGARMLTCERTYERT